jgi:hypothetical protein
MEVAAEGDRRTPGCRRNMYGTNGITSAVCQSITAAQLGVQLQSLAPAYFVKCRSWIALVSPRPETSLLNGSHWQLDAGEQGPTLFDAVNKLGLTLDRQKESVEIFVVDRCEKLPTEN